MTTETEQYFLERAAESGIPTTTDAIKNDIQTDADAAGLTFNNPSEYSPWWKFLTAVAVNPVNQLIQFVITHVMPNLFVKTATGDYLDILGEDKDVPRKGEAVLTGKIRFTRDSIGSTLDVPAGTWIRTAPINGKTYRVKTTAAAQFGATQYSIEINVEAESAGAGYNLAAGYFVILENPITSISYVENEDGWITSPGADKESDDAYRARIRARFTAASEWHVNDVYKSIIAEFTGIDYNRIYIDHTEAPRGPGSADALVLFDTDVPGVEFLEAVNDYITVQGHHGHGDDLQVKPLPETQHDISQALYVIAGTSAERQAEIITHAENIIRCAFRENTDYSTIKTWPYARFSMSALAEEITSRIPELTSVEFSTGDIVSALNVPRLQTLTSTIAEDAF